MVFLSKITRFIALALAIALALPASGAGKAWAAGSSVISGDTLTVTGGPAGPGGAGGDAIWTGSNLPEIAPFAPGILSLTLRPGAGAAGSAVGFTGGNAIVAVTGDVLIFGGADALGMGGPGIGNGGAGDSPAVRGGNGGTATLDVGGNLTVSGDASQTNIMAGAGGGATIGIAGAGSSQVLSVGGLFSTIGAAAGTGGGYTLTAGAGGITAGMGTGGSGGSIFTAHGSMDIWSTSALIAGAGGAGAGTGGAGGDIIQNVSGAAVIGASGMGGTHTVIAGNGGLAAGAGSGGNGGGAWESYGSLAIRDVAGGGASGNAAYISGAGGFTSGGGNGGAGGSIALSVTGLLAAEGTYTVTAGGGGSAVSTGNGGDGGSFVASAGSMDVAGGAAFIAGAGGAGNAATAFTGSGGQGGWIALSVESGAHYRASLISQAGAGGISGHGQGGNAGDITMAYGPAAATMNALTVEGNFVHIGAMGGFASFDVNGGDASMATFLVGGNSSVHGDFTADVGAGGMAAGAAGSATGGSGSTFFWGVVGDSDVGGSFIKAPRLAGTGAAGSTGAGGDTGDWVYLAQRTLNIGGGTTISGNSGGLGQQGAGGFGRATDLNVGFDLYTATQAAGAFTLAGGDGGSTNGAGAGGQAESTSLTVGRDFVSQDTSVTFTAGAGGLSGLGLAARGNAADGGHTVVAVGRGLLTAGNVLAAAGAAGAGGDGDGLSGNGGDLTIMVGREFQARAAGSVFTAGAGSGGFNAATGASGADGGNLAVTAGTFDFESAVFAGGNAGAGDLGGTGGRGGDLTATVTRRAASFTDGFTGLGGNANTNIASAANGAGGDMTFANGDADTGGDVFVGGGFGLAGGQGVAAQPTTVTGAGTASFTARSLLGLNGVSNAVESGGGAFGAGAAIYETGFTRNDWGGTLLRVRKNEGGLAFRSANLVAFDGNASGINPGYGFTVSFDSPSAANAAVGNNAGFANAVMTNGSQLTIRRGDRTDNWGRYAWDRNGTIYAANALQFVDGYNPNKLLVGVAPINAPVDTVTAYERVTAANRTVHFDVANLRPTPNSVNAGILLVNNDAPVAERGLLINGSTALTVTGADNLRPGQTVDLVNVAGGSSVPGPTSGTLGDGYGNLADAGYALAWSGVHNAPLEFTLGAFKIRNNWVIDLDRDLQTVAPDDARTLRVPGGLSIVDNPFIGRDNLGIVVDDQRGAFGTSSLWANRIEVATVNDLTNVWQTPGALATVTILDFNQAVAGNLADIGSHGVAFGGLALRSASRTHLLGDMGETGIGTYAFGGRLEVGTMFRGEHTSARLLNSATNDTSALRVDNAVFHLSDDLHYRAAENEAAARFFNYDLNERSGDMADMAAYPAAEYLHINRLASGDNRVVLLEVLGRAWDPVARAYVHNGGVAPIVRFDRPGSIGITQSIASMSAMLAGDQFVLIDHVQSGSTIAGQTFAQSNGAVIQARSWAGSGFLEGVYDVTYGANDRFARNDAVIGTFNHLAADLGKSALQARSAAELLVNQGQDLIVDLMGNATPAGPYDAATGRQLVAFAAATGGYRSVDTGSDASGTAFSLAAGPGLSLDSDMGRTALGILLEAGWGDFDLNNYFAWRGGFDADADSAYYGAALVARHELPGGLYGEASLRAGVVDTDYEGNQSATGFSTDSAYLGGHAGLGYKLDAWPDGMVDVYAMGLFTYMGSDDTNNAAGEHLELDSSTSARSRLGVRVSHRFTPEFRGYAGGAWEYEFDGKQKGSISMIGSPNAASIPGIDTQGHTGIGELGFEWSATPNLSLGAGFQGAFGQREGYGGAIRLIYNW